MRNELVIALVLALAGACAPTEAMMVTSPDLPPQRSPDELERDPVWLANCVVAAEITLQGGLGAPLIRNGPALLAKRQNDLASYMPDNAVRAKRLETTRQEWARLLNGKNPEARHQELDSMVSVCGGEYTRP